MGWGGGGWGGRVGWGKSRLLTISVQLILELGLSLAINIVSKSDEETEAIEFVVAKYK